MKPNRITAFLFLSFFKSIEKNLTTKKTRVSADEMPRKPERKKMKKKKQKNEKEKEKKNPVALPSFTPASS